MAIADVAEYAHLSEADIEALAAELEAIRRDVEDSRGQRDSAYIRRTKTIEQSIADTEESELAEAFRWVGKPGFATVISGGALVGLTTVMMILMVGQSRVFFAMSRDRLL